MRTSVLVGLVAGTALSMSAFAQEAKEITPIRKDVATRNVTRVTEAGPGSTCVLVAPGTRSVGPELVYDNLGWDGTTTMGSLDYWFWFGFLNAPHHADDICLVPGNMSQLYAPGGQLLTRQQFIFDIQDGFASGARAFDMVVTFWDSADPASVAPATAFMDPLGAYTFSGVLAAGTYIIDVDLVGTFPVNGGLQLTDNAFHMEVAFYETGTTTYLPAGDGAAMDYNCTSTWGTAGMSPTLVNGGGRNWFFFDPNADGQCANNERYVAGGVGGYFLQCNFAQNFFGDARCPADFDNNGFTEPLDYNLFINAFEAGPCPP